VKYIALMFAVAVAFTLLTSEAKIIATNEIIDIEVEFAQADNETLVIFDYDDVLLEPVDAALLGENEKVSDKIAIDLMKSKDVKGKSISKDQMITALSILTRDMKTRLVHGKWPLLLSVLQSRGIKTVLLTSCGAGRQGVVEAVENVRAQHLRNVGIDFRKSWIGVKRFEFPNIPRKSSPFCNFHCPSFVDGMLFASGADKGGVLKAFLSKIPQYKFKKIIFIDDKLKNLKSVEKVCNEIGVQFIGIEFTYSKIKKHPILDPGKVRVQYKTLGLEKRWISDEEMDKTFYDRMLEIVDFGVVRSCAGHQPTEEQIFAAVRKSVSEKEISDNDLGECIDDFFEVRNKIYNMVGFVCQLEFARKANAEKIDTKIILDCVNDNLFVSGPITKISENLINDINASLKDEILSTGCGSVWKDFAKYNFIRSKLFGEKNDIASYKQLPTERYKKYVKIVEKVYDFDCESCFLNCKYNIARNFIKHGVKKDMIYKIFGFDSEEFEDFVKPVN
jgi:hypothetical protein